MSISVIIAVVIIGAIYYSYITKMKKMKASNQDFIAAHPEAVKIFLTTKALITSEAVTVYSVDDEAPQSFIENGKSGLYVIPGSRIVEMAYTYSRPGIVHKNVTQTIGPEKKELLVENGKEYLLGFDRENESFIFKEL